MLDFWPHRWHYFSHHINREVKEIYWQSILSNLALSMVFIFEPIFLYTLGYSLTWILLFYVLVYLGYTIFIFAGAKFASFAGYKHSILVSNIFYVAYWIILYLIKFHPALFFVAPFLFSLQKSFFWPAFNADVSKFAAKSQTGREMGVLFSLTQISLILGPFLGGLILAKFNFLTLFLLAAGLMLFSVYPMFLSREVYTEHNFTFKNFRKVLARYKQNFFGYWGYAEDLMLMSLWPIFMFIAIPSLLNVGIINTVASLAATVLMLYVGKLSDRWNLYKLIRDSSVFYGLTWVLRFLAQGVGAVLLFDGLTKVGKALVNVPMISLTYETAGSKDADFAIAYSTFFEFSLAVGKIFTALLGILILSLTGNIFIVFALVGILTLFYGLLRK